MNEHADKQISLGWVIAVIILGTGLMSGLQLANAGGELSVVKASAGNEEGEGTTRARLPLADDAQDRRQAAELGRGVRVRVRVRVSVS